MFGPLALLIFTKHIQCNFEIKLTFILIIIIIFKYNANIIKDTTEKNYFINLFEKNLDPDTTVDQIE